jgi:hypothetical protein
MKPVREYTVIGTSYPMPGIRDKVTGQTQWSCDVTLPGMLHARMVRPATLGSTLISVGEVDKKRFPTAEVVRKGNLVAVVSPNEWEAVSALRSVAAGTKWSSWSGLPGSENLTQAMRAYPWGAPDASMGDAAKVQAALGKAAKTLWPMCAAMGLPPFGPRRGICRRPANASPISWAHQRRKSWCTG